MKILFYDIKDFELDYLLDKIPVGIEPCFLKIPLNELTYIDEKYADTEALSVFVSSELNDKVLSKFKNLKFIFLRCVGYSNVDMEYCKENNIYVFNTPNYANATVAEYTFGLILALSKKIVTSFNDLKEGKADVDEIRGIELKGKTLGVIGAGSIGRRVISIAHGFCMDVMVYDTIQKGAYNFVELDELYKKSDFISINCPLTDSTRGLIDKDAISMMKKNAVIINTARGEIIDTQALYEGLINKKIQGAGLDVIECEEVICKVWEKCSQNDVMRESCLKKYYFIQKLMQLPNVIITPHNAYNTKEAQIKILNITLENIQASFNFDSSAKNLVLI